MTEVCRKSRYCRSRSHCRSGNLRRTKARRQLSVGPRSRTCFATKAGPLPSPAAALRHAAIDVPSTASQIHYLAVGRAVQQVQAVSGTKALTSLRCPRTSHRRSLPHSAPNLPVQQQQWEQERRGLWVRLSCPPQLTRTGPRRREWMPLGARKTARRQGPSDTEIVGRRCHSRLPGRRSRGERLYPLSPPNWMRGSRSIGIRCRTPPISILRLIQG